MSRPRSRIPNAPADDGPDDCYNSASCAADNAQSLLRQLPVRLADEPRDLERAWDLACRYDAHPIYAMVSVALAERRRARLFTADAELRKLLGDFDWIVALEALVG